MGIKQIIKILEGQGMTKAEVMKEIQELKNNECFFELSDDDLEILQDYISNDDR